PALSVARFRIHTAMGQWRIVEKQPAHRPSRRNDIVDAAVRIFADKGYAEAADVEVTAVHYHFSGKDDPFAAAMRASLDSISAVVIAARAAAGAASADGLRLAVDAVWHWIDDNPYGASLVHTHLPGTIRQLSAIRQEFSELHERRAFDYLGDGSPTGARQAAARMGTGTLTMRTLIDALIALHAMRMADGPLSTASPASLRSATHRVARQMLLHP
ncbi:MAG: TetR/AcrR family transcriptional regulator, partial [Ilumatobacteraceae bacterium]|nr:TetR/AcrR family transcriptional regulator [Ilumatobacteraceae bacterium]